MAEMQKIFALGHTFTARMGIIQEIKKLSRYKTFPGKTKV